MPEEITTNTQVLRDAAIKDVRMAAADAVKAKGSVSKAVSEDTLVAKVIRKVKSRVEKATQSKVF